MIVLKKILVIVLCLQIVLPNPLLQELTRLPALLSHYFEHDQAGKHMHFYDFIVQHYSDHQHRKKEDNNHNNLPFQHLDLNLQQITFPVAVLDTDLTDLPDHTVQEKKDGMIKNQDIHSSSAFSSIWRPPKVN